MLRANCNTRAKGGYIWRQGTWERKLDPVRKCKFCGEPAVFEQPMCHDCTSESSASYLPTPEQIEEVVKLIQKEWVDEEFYTRSIGRSGPYEIPTVREYKHD